MVGCTLAPAASFPGILLPLLQTILVAQESSAALDQTRLDQTSSTRVQCYSAPNSAPQTAFIQHRAKQSASAFCLIKDLHNTQFYDVMMSTPGLGSIENQPCLQSLISNLVQNSCLCAERDFLGTVVFSVLCQSNTFACSMVRLSDSV